MTLARALREAFDEPEPRAKAAAALAAARWSADGELGPAPEGWPQRPGRPARPVLVDPRKLPKRNAASPRGRIALLHALAHIELNAIDLAVDIVGRFAWTSGVADARAFAADWLSVAADEARHFLMLADRLVELGASYGDLPAHDGLWDLARRTSGDLQARLALAPLVQEARGLDVTPGLIDKLRSVGDGPSAAILEAIYRDEIGHVATGHRWFERTCGADDAARRFAAILADNGVRLHPPFNAAARRAAGLTPSFLESSSVLSVTDRLKSPRSERRR